MHITTGLTTPEEFWLCPFLPTQRLGSRHGRGRPTTTHGYEFKISPFISDINALLSGSVKALFRVRNGGQTAPLSPPGFVLAAASTSGGQQTIQVHLIRDARCQSDSPVRTTQFHNPLILLDCKLTCRRLECKQNFRQKRPQNRLRAARLVPAVQPTPGPSPNPMSRCNLNPLLTGVSCHGQ